MPLTSYRIPGGQIKTTELLVLFLSFLSLLLLLLLLHFSQLMIICSIKMTAPSVSCIAGPVFHTTASANASLSLEGIGRSSPWMGEHTNMSLFHVLSFGTNTSVCRIYGNSLKHLLLFLFVWHKEHFLIWPFVVTINWVDEWSPSNAKHVTMILLVNFSSSEITTNQISSKVHRFSLPQFKERSPKDWLTLTQNHVRRKCVEREAEETALRTNDCASCSCRRIQVECVISEWFGILQVEA